MFDEMKRYVRFGAEDEARLRATLPLVQPSFPVVVDRFYQRIEEHPRALAVMLGGRAQIERLKETLTGWLRRFFEGPWDDAYFEDRARIGRRHVEIKLPQQYAFTAMNVIRSELKVALRAHGQDVETAARCASIDKLLDLELAIQLHTYTEDYVGQLQRKERLATFGQLTSTIGHELRNPLGVIESSIYLLRHRAGDDPSVVRHLDKVAAQVARSNRIIVNMLDIVRDKLPMRAAVAPAALAQAAARALSEDRGRELELVIEQGLPAVRVDREHMLRVLANVLDNAVEASGPDGRLRLSVRAAGAHIELAVEDSGPGVDPEILPRLFEPLVTGRDNGVGLGLALCKKLVEANEAELAVGQSAELGGASFILRLRAVA